MSETDHLTEPLYIHFDDQKGESTEFGSQRELYHNQATGESVHMCLVNPGMSLPIGDSCRNGEELFVYNGSLITEEEEYTKWGWIRFPAATYPLPKRTLLKAGTTGAQVYRKTGHLAESAMAMEKIKITDD
mmetsp:Transcript_14520/g.31535  ORF Transcript_14520/g.31535 Transcript_14520/m.31535 type:complete len:131 (-) Transcript_14520:3-395(-)